MRIYEILTEDEEIDFDKIKVTIHHDTKYNITRYSFGVPLSYDAELEIYIIVDEDTLDFADLITTIGNHPNRFYSGAGAVYGKGIRLGTGVTKNLIRYIINYVRQRHPEITKIKSNRVTGARIIAGKQNMNLELPRNLVEKTIRIPDGTGSSQAGFKGWRQ